ncbi:MAG: threonine-phosphate decarboxylase CobD [Sedimentibacter sp.]
MNVNSHGADIYTASKETGIEENEIIDFSSNINPLGIPKNVESAAINSIKYSDRYPDINSRELVKAIALYEQVLEEWIFTSNGAAEAIFRIAVYLKPKNGLVTAPAFSEYEQSLKTVGTCINYYRLHEKSEFKITNSILNSINVDTDIVFICNPNNPTGQLADKETLEKIISRCKEIGATAVIDECFLDFVDSKEKYSVSSLMKKYDNLIILKAFTKTYAIPGIRLGYCMSSNIEIINGLKSSGPPWNVSTIAQAAGVAALKEKEYVQKSVSYIYEQRNYLVDEMNKLKIKTYESHANYIFFKITEEVDLKEELLKKGILIRSCSNYMNLSNKYYRIAVRTRIENKLFIDKLKEIMGKR